MPRIVFITVMHQLIIPKVNKVSVSANLNVQVSQWV